MGIALLALGLAAACGPSLRRVQESRVYFERCYSADFDARIPLAEKHACWSAWLEHYTAGQPPERASYARERVYAIDHAEETPRLPGLPEAALGPRRVAPVTASATELEAAPEIAPENADEEELDAPLETPRRARRRRRPRPMPRTSNATCAARACEAPWRSCLERCTDVRACQTACEVELQACARGCF